MSSSEYIRVIVVPDAKRVVACLSEISGIRKSGGCGEIIVKDVHGFRLRESDWKIVSRAAGLLSFTISEYIRQVVLADAKRVVEVMSP